MPEGDRENQDEANAADDLHLGGTAALWNGSASAELYLGLWLQIVPDFTRPGSARSDQH